MEYRPLGSTGIDVSVLAFGCGPVADLMTERDTTRQSHGPRSGTDTNSALASLALCCKLW